MAFKQNFANTNQIFVNIIGLQGSRETEIRETRGSAHIFHRYLGYLDNQLMEALMPMASFLYGL